MMRKLTLLFGFCLLAACSGQPPVPKDHYYRLPQPEISSELNPLTDGTIFVEQFIADGIHRERALAYAEDSAPTEVFQHHYHHWIESPSLLLRDQLIDYLRARQAGRVITDSPGVPAELSIYGKIRRFDQIVKSGAIVVVVSLEFRVEKAGSGEPLLVRDYERRLDPGGSSMNAAVSGFGAALSEIFSRLLGDLHAVL